MSKEETEKETEIFDNIHPLKIRLQSKDISFIFNSSQLKEPKLDKSYKDKDRIFISGAIKINVNDINKFLNQAKEFINITKRAAMAAKLKKASAERNAALRPQVRRLEEQIKDLKENITQLKKNGDDTKKLEERKYKLTIDLEAFTEQLERAKQLQQRQLWGMDRDLGQSKLDEIEFTWPAITQNDWITIASISTTDRSLAALNIFLDEKKTEKFFYFLQKNDNEIAENTNREKEILKDNISLILNIIFDQDKTIINFNNEYLKISKIQINNDSLREIKDTDPWHKEEKVYYEITINISYTIITSHTLIKYLITLRGDFNYIDLLYHPIYSIPTLDTQYSNVYLPTNILLTEDEIASINLNELNIKSYMELFFKPNIFAKFILKIKNAHKYDKKKYGEDKIIIENIKLITRILFHSKTKSFNKITKQLFGKNNYFKYQDISYEIIKYWISKKSIRNNRYARTPIIKNNDTIYDIYITLDILNKDEPITTSRKLGIHCDYRIHKLNKLVQKLKPNSNFKFGNINKRRENILNLYNIEGGSKKLFKQTYREKTQRFKNLREKKKTRKTRTRKTRTRKTRTRKTRTRK